MLCFTRRRARALCLCSVPLHVPAPWGPWDRGQLGLALQGGQAGQGRAGGLSGRERTFIIPSSRYSAQGFVQWHWGGSKLSREEWLWTGDCTGGAELHPNQENNPMDPTAKESQGQWAR